MTDKSKRKLVFEDLRSDLPEGHPKFASERDILDALNVALQRRQIKSYRKHESIYLPDVSSAVVCTVEEGGCVGKGFSFCSKKDQFQRKRGRQIAAGRAIKDLKKELSKA